MPLEPEAGVDRAAELLARYDRDTRTWDIERRGSFWEAVALLDTMQGAVEDPLVAIVDTSFDLTVPALGEHECVLPVDPGQDTTHGTVVALLVLSVAPRARLLLYPVGRAGSLDETLAAQALEDAVRRGARVVNLSMGVKRPMTEWFDAPGFEAAVPTDEQREFAVIRLLARSGFRDWLTVPSTPVGDAALRVSGGQTSVVASAGNVKRTLSTPAVLEGVTGVGFISEHREEHSDGLEVATAAAPAFAQAAFFDVAVVQPPHVLGSSFATPLVSGFAARCCAPGELSAWTAGGRLAGMGSELLVEVQDDHVWGPDRHGLIDELYLRALQLFPHHHELETSTIQPCAACSFFALPAYNDYGLLKLRWSDFRGAEILFRTARAFAPASAFTASNLAHAYVAIADRQDPGNLPAVRDFRGRAVAHMAAAVELRPDHAIYGTLLAEYRARLAETD